MQANQYKMSYAVDSFQEIDAAYPKDDRYFIMGYDNFSQIETWKDGKKLVQNRKFIVFERTNTSSTLVRQKVRANESIEKLV